jgi:hypothetical protein
MQRLILSAALCLAGIAGLFAVRTVVGARSHCGAAERYNCIVSDACAIKGRSAAIPLLRHTLA